MWKIKECSASIAKSYKNLFRKKHLFFDDSLFALVVSSDGNDGIFLKLFFQILLIFLN